MPESFFVTDMWISCIFAVFHCHLFVVIYGKRHYNVDEEVSATTIYVLQYDYIQQQEAQLPQRQRASNIRRRMHFDMLNRLGMDHECDKQTDGQTDR